jgi:AraC-like DNA-binding protein
MAANAHATTVAMTCTSGTFAAENSGSFDAYLGTMNNQMINGNDLIGIYAFQINSINPNNLTISSPFYATCLSPQGVLYTGTPYTYTVESYVTASPGLDPGSWVSPGKAPYAGILNANYLFQTLSGSIISSQNADQGAAMALAMYTALYNSTGYGTVADGADLSAPNGQAQFVIPGLTGSVLSYYENDLGDHRSQMLRIAAAVLSVEFLNARGHQSGFVRAEDHAIQVFESLSADELLMLSVGELAIRFSCSRRHLNRLFHQHFGVSVGRLKMEMRLLKAISLLRDPDAKIINVAGQCGFNHLGLFNTCFKRRFNSSPGQWRKIALQNPEKAASAFNAGLLSNEPSNQVSSPAIHADSSSLIKAKVYQFLKEAYPAGATNDTEGDRAGKQGRAARAPKTRLSGQDFRSPPMD